MVKSLKNAPVVGKPPTAEDILKSLAPKNATSADDFRRYQSVPAIDDMIAKIIGRFGSTDAFADAFYECFKQSKVGSLTRTRMIEKVLDMIRIHAQLYNTTDDLEDVSEAELRQIFAEELGVTVENEDEEKAKPAKAAKKGESNGDGPVL